MSQGIIASRKDSEGSELFGFDLTSKSSLRYAEISSLVQEVQVRSIQKQIDPQKDDAINKIIINCLFKQFDEKRCRSIQQLNAKINKNKMLTKQGDRLERLKSLADKMLYVLIEEFRALLENEKHLEIERNKAHEKIMEMYVGLVMLELQIEVAKEEFISDFVETFSESMGKIFNNASELMREVASDIINNEDEMIALYEKSEKLKSSRGQGLAISRNHNLLANDMGKLVHSKLMAKYDRGELQLRNPEVSRTEIDFQLKDLVAARRLKQLSQNRSKIAKLLKERNACAAEMKNEFADRTIEVSIDMAQVVRAAKEEGVKKAASFGNADSLDSRDDDQEISSVYSKPTR